jgi:N-methylhydantoinase B
LRESLRSSRAPLPLFNRGPDIEQLRERCLEETGLPAPVAPSWSSKEKRA